VRSRTVAATQPLRFDPPADGAISRRHRGRHDVCHLGSGKRVEPRHIRVVEVPQGALEDRPIAQAPRPVYLLLGLGDRKKPPLAGNPL
jgi:hypothetical protein